MSFLLFFSVSTQLLALICFLDAKVVCLLCLCDDIVYLFMAVLRLFGLICFLFKSFCILQCLLIGGGFNATQCFILFLTESEIWCPTLIILLCSLQPSCLWERMFYLHGDLQFFLSFSFAFCSFISCVFRAVLVFLHDLCSFF